VSTEPETSIPSVELAGGSALPQLGLGVFQVPAPKTATIVATALEVGYRSVDTAAAYGNEEGVGEAVAESGIERSELWITTKLANTEHGRERALAAFEQSLRALRLDYVDLFLIHWPAPMNDLYIETWEALVELAEGGGAQAIGVSNFNIEHLERIIEETGVVPAVNQVELHPGFDQAELRAFHAAHGIVTESWSPLAQADPRLFEHPTLGEVAAAHGKTPAQVILRWHIQLGCVVIPKASSRARLEENMAVFDFELDTQEVRALDAIDAIGRTGPDPSVFFMGWTPDAER
jgi:2,5-diketo-D-gluconate reductase A